MPLFHGAAQRATEDRPFYKLEYDTTAFPELQALFSRRYFGGMLNHRPLNRAKMVSMTAVPEVIQERRQIAFEPNWKGRGYASYVFAAPVTIAGTPTYVAAVVDQRPDNKLYLSGVVDSEGNYIRIEESPSSDTKRGVTVPDGVTTTPERDSEDLTPNGAKHPGPAPGLSRTASSPVEGTRPLNSDFTIAPGGEKVNGAARAQEKPDHQRRP